MWEITIDVNQKYKPKDVAIPDEIVIEAEDITEKDGQLLATSQEFQTVSWSSDHFGESALTTTHTYRVPYSRIKKIERV